MNFIVENAFEFLSVVWGGAALISFGLMLFRKPSRSGEPIMEKDWSSPGGGRGGWRLSPSFSMLCQGLVFLILAVTALAFLVTSGGME